MTWTTSYNIRRGIAAALLTHSCVVAGTSTARADEAKAISGAPVLPVEIPEPSADGIIYLPGADGQPRATNLVPHIQSHLTSYLVDAQSPIAALVLADVRTGNILAMVQGRKPENWGGHTHSALHGSFPAASVFKTVVTTAAFEVTDMDSHLPIGLTGGCSHVRETGDWMREHTPGRLDSMTLRSAFGKSCNGFFAKIGVNNLGLGIISEFARRFGWETGIPADFHVDRSPFVPPVPQYSSTHTVGSFAAGFGKVGLSAAHAAYMMLTVANSGSTTPLRLFRDSPSLPPVSQRPRIYSPATAERLREILDSSVRGGTAGFAFKRGKYRKLHEIVGGKTGTLTGSSPKGLTTWFAGLAPTNDPEVVVAAVVVLEDRWRIKGPNLAAEALSLYFDRQYDRKAMSSARLVPVAKGRGKFSVK